jgi:lipid-binding SYLF domain-containing protein
MTDSRDAARPQPPGAGAWMLGALLISVASQLACSHGQTGTQPPRMANADELLDDATDVVSAIERDLSPRVVDVTRCIAVVPAQARSHAAHGSEKGFVACRAGTAWSPPIPMTLSGENAAVKAASGDLIMLVMTDRAMEKCRRASLRLGVDVSVASGPVGSDTSSPPSAEVLSYLRSGGVLAGVDLSDATIEQSQHGAVGLYGRPMDARQLLGGMSE